jgi:hypothetical protein
MHLEKKLLAAPDSGLFIFKKGRISVENDPCPNDLLSLNTEEMMMMMMMMMICVHDKIHSDRSWKQPEE